MKLKCDIRVQNFSSQADGHEKFYKDATLSIYRAEESNNSTSNIILIVKPKTSSIEIKYKLSKIETYTKFISEGKSTINLMDKNILLLISNTPPQNLINFISFLKIKFNKNKDLKIEFDKENSYKENEQKKPKKETNTYLNKLLSNADCLYSKNDLKVISPLTSGEISSLMRNTKTNSSTPVRPVNTENAGNASNKLSRQSASSNALRELSVNNSDLVGKRILNDKNTGDRKAELDSKEHQLKRSNSGLVKLTSEQINVLKAVKEGKNIFITGGAGVGKSFLIKMITKCLKADHLYITASTGIASCLISGVTLHAFAGINANDLKLPVDVVVEKIKNSRAKLENWKKCKYLIIDEISMIDGDLFDYLNEIAKAIKGNDRPFGGIQIILSGDFLQLPPVSRYNENKKFCFQAKCWTEVIELTLKLTEVLRQNDKNFVDLLEELRFGRCSKSAVELLTNTKYNKIENEGILPTRLCTHKDDVDLINKVELDALKTESNIYKSVDSESAHRGILNTLCTVKDELVLKIGAQVMLVKNMDMSCGLVNGSRGIVVGFTKDSQKFPIVRFYNGKEITIKLEVWTFRLNSNINMTRMQLPLQLAWALSIHKSQGMTLDCVEISLARVFECGQAYVALSRARSLKNLRLIDFDVNTIRANDVVVKYYQGLKSL